MTNLQRTMRLRVQAWSVACSGARHAEQAPALKAGTFKGRPETSESKCRMREGVGWPHRSDEVGEREGTLTRRSKGAPELSRASEGEHAP